MNADGRSECNEGSDNASVVESVMKTKDVCKFPKYKERFVGLFVSKRASPAEPALIVIGIQQLPDTKQLYLIQGSLHYPSKISYIHLKRTLE